MKKLIIAGVSLVVLAGAGFAAYRLGWVGGSGGAAVPGGRAAAAQAGSASAMEATAQASVPAAAAGQRAAEPLAAPPAVSALPLDAWRQDTFRNQDPYKIWAQYAKAATEELNRPGADPSDVGARAAALGGDREKIFTFLRDQITLEPYSGVLRGARGTLAAEAGNALDRTLLGQALLKAGGIESRIVSGALAEAQAQQLLDQYLARQPVSGPLASVLPDDGLHPGDAAAQDVASKIGLPADRIAELMQHARAVDAAFWSRADGERAVRFEFVSTELRHAGIGSSPDPSLRQKLVARLKDHWWLQVRDAAGAWSDFDPSFSDSRPGTAYGAGPAPRPTIPPALSHRFEIRLLYRTGAPASPKAEEILKGQLASADALFEPLEFRIQPEKVPADSKALLQMSPAGKIAMLRGMKRFQGFVRAGSKATPGRVFDLEGHTYDAPGGNPMASPGGLMGGMLGFGGEGGGGGAFVDLQVVMRLTGPGREPMTQTRTILRAADIATPTFAPPLVEWSILVQPQWVARRLADHQLLRLLLALGKVVIDARTPDRQDRPAEPAAAIPGPLLQLALLRQRAVASMLAGPGNIHALVDEPMVTIAAHRLAALQAQEGRITGRRTIDIVANPVRYVTGDAAAQAAAFDVALRQGVADSTLEQAVVEATSPPASAGSGSAIFDRAKAEGRAAVVARPAEQDKLRSAGMSDADVAWIRANEHPRATLIAAATAGGPAAWWSIGPTGTAVLRMSGGGGQAHAEHETDVMLVSLKVLFGMVCAYEFVEAAEGPASAMAGWKLAFCAAATGGSVGFLISGWHAASWLLIGAEVAELLISKGIE